MSRLAELLPHTNAPVSLVELEAAEEMFGTSLPPDLREFLLVSNGSEWSAFAECGFQIHSLQTMLDLWTLPEEHRSGLHVIDVASDGSRERYCFDPRTDGIVLQDIVGDQAPAACASTITELVEKLSAGWKPFSVDDE